MTVTDAANIIKGNEWLRLQVYRDSRGIKTRGWGHRCDPDEVVGTKITQAQADETFAGDLNDALQAALGALSRSGAPGYAGQLQDCWNRGRLDPRHVALLDLAFNLGEDGLLKFPAMLRAICAGDWKRAAEELLLTDPENADRLTLLINPESKCNACRLAHNSEPPKHLR